VRLFASRLAGLPHKPEEGTALPAAAVDYLAARGKADEVVLKAKLDPSLFPSVSGPVPAALPAASSAPAAQPSPAAPAGQAAAPAPSQEAHVEGEIKVGGSTTFGALRAWGLSDAEIEKIAGIKPGADGAPVRDAVQAAGGSFSDVKEKLQAAALAKKR